MADRDDDAMGGYREPGWMAGSGSRPAPGPPDPPGGPGGRPGAPDEPVTGPGQRGDLRAPRGGQPRGQQSPGRRRPAPSAAQQRLMTHIAAGRKARQRRLMLTVSAALSVVVLFVAGTAWGF